MPALPRLVFSRPVDLEGPTGTTFPHELAPVQTVKTLQAGSSGEELQRQLSRQLPPPRLVLLTSQSAQRPAQPEQRFGELTVGVLAGDSELEQAIVRSRDLLNRSENWDDEGARPYTRATWQRAIDLIREQALAMLRLGERMPVPRIMPGPAGGIDLLWRVAGFELLVNVPEGAAPITYYGDDRGDEIAKGAIPAGKTLSFAPWLIRK